MALMSEVNPGGFRHPEEVHSTMLEEAPVFDSQHRIYHHRGNIVVLDHLTLGTLPNIKHRRNGFWLKFIGLKITRLTADAGHRSGIEMNRCWLGAVVRIRAGRNFNTAINQLIAPHRGGNIFAIACLLEVGGNLLCVNLFTNAHNLRNGVDGRRTGKNWPTEALLNNAVVFDVKVRERTCNGDGKYEENNECGFNHWVR